MAFDYFFESPDRQSLVVVASDDRTVWAYLHVGGEIISDVWLWNLGPAPDEMETDQTRPPANPARYCSPEPVPVGVAPDDVDVVWNYDGKVLSHVEIGINGVLIARLAPAARPGWSRFAAIDGPCARCLHSPLG